MLTVIIFFYICASVFKANSSFAIKSNEISHFENFSHTSHLNLIYISFTFSSKYLEENHLPCLPLFMFLPPKFINLFFPDAPFLYPLKTLENLRFSDVFRRLRKDALGTNRLMTSV